MADQPLSASSRLSGLRRLSVRLGTPFPGALASTLAGTLLVVVLGPSFGAPAGVGVAAAGFLGVSTLMLAGLDRAYPHPSFGACNAVTHLRLALVALLCVALLPGGTAGEGRWPVVAIAALALALDGIDGWLARRSGLVSRFGARFDVEIDCALALALASIAWLSGAAGVWVMALGLAHYAFWAAAAFWPWLSGPLPERLSRKAVGVLQIGTLLALATPAVMPPLSTALALVAVAAVGWSFAVDIRHLHQTRT